MKSKLFLLFALVWVFVQTWAAPVNLSQAQLVAQNFTMSNGNLYASTVGGGLKLAHAEPSCKLKDQPVFYVFNMDNSFVIVAGDDRAENILGYGDGQFDINNIPDGMRDLLGIYKEEIEFLQVNPKLIVQKNFQGSPTLSATSVSPLLSTKWGQKSPYYNQCPKYGTKRCLTGCVATAMAQIMQYWKYPNSSPAIKSYYTDSLNILVEALPSKTLSYDKSDGSVAWLMRYAGQAVEMDYTPDGSGAFDIDAKNAMVNTFKYSSSAQYKTKGSDDTQWHTLLKTELNAGHPVYYRASHKNDNGTYSGHAFVIDGYNSAGKYHINWGWDGDYSSSSTYFSLNAFNPGSYKFNYKQAMIIDLRPMTILSINPSPVVFNSKTVGKTYTASISIKGYDLTGDLTLKLTGATGVFSIDKTTITKSAATSGTTVKVTYKPTAAGTQTATITISGGGLTSSKTISLKGIAVKREITVNPSSLTFLKVPKNTSKTMTFKVTGTNLTSSLSVKLTDVTGMFKISKTSITAAQAKNGYTITVTYTPTAVGTHVAKVTISGGDALASKTVSLKGTCVKNNNITPCSIDNTLEVLDRTTLPNVNTNGTDVENLRGGSGAVMAPSNPFTGVDELSVDSRVYAEGQNIIIESPVEQSAVLSDISGHVMNVDLKVGRNEIPVNSTGLYIVRIRDKATKLMLR